MKCKWCEAGDKPKVLDTYGVASHVSGRKGKWCHVDGGYYWLCPKLNKPARRGTRKAEK